MVEVFREVKRVLRNDGTLWLNLGDSYCGTGNKGEYKDPKYLDGRNGQKVALNNKIKGLKAKDLVGIPWRVAFALQADGWYLRSDIIWAKPNPMPESVRDRPTKAHEYIFLLSKSKRYFYDAEAIKEPASNEGKLVSLGDKSFSRGQAKGKGIKPSGNGNADEYLVPAGRNKRTVWNISTKPFSEAHFAVFPPDLIEPCILAGTSPMACPHCGAPWERVVERIAGVSKECPKTQAAHEARGGTGKPSGTVGKSGGGRIDSISRTIGWRPTCACPDNDGSGRCVVLDPFAGAGTTLWVAEQLGRNSIGIELNPDYCDIIRRRMAGLVGIKY
jgi:DNA modification methylase